MSLINLKRLKRKPSEKVKVSITTVKIWYYQDEVNYAFTMQQFIDYLEKIRNIEVVL